MSNKQQTAVEWLMDKLPHSIETQFSKQIEQAKELEKKQIMDAFNNGVNDECIGSNKTPEQYYNETFNK